MRSNWIERYTTPLLWTAALLFFTAVAYRIWNQKGLRPEADSIYLLQAIVLLATAIVLIFYTYETYKLREVAQQQIEVAQQQVREAQRQTELGQQPFVVTDIVYAPANQYPQVAVKNIGNGTAINIRIQDAEARHPTETIIYRFPEIVPTLSCGGVPVVVTCVPERYVEGKRISLSLAPTDLDPHRATTASTLVRLEFANIEGQFYFVEEQIARQSFEIVQCGRVASDKAS